MKELEYPFDSEFILSKKKRIKRELLDKNEQWIEKKIAILGGYTTNDIKLIMELFLLNYGIKPVFYESEYNQFYEDAVFQNTELINFSPDIIYVCTCNRNILRYPEIGDSTEQINSLLQREYSRYQEVWETLNEKYRCPIIQNNFEMPFYRILGNKDASDIHGRTNYLSRLNMMFYEYSQNHSNFYICDINYLAADYGLKTWSDPFYWYMYKYAVAVPAIPYLSFNVANIIKSIFGKNKKGFVLDLDNTLWGGIIGDDGVDNIILGPEESEGQAYLEFQDYIHSFKQIGVILTINSKNEYENAIKGINHPNSKFVKDDFAVIKANWNPKNRNFIEIASELNVLPESLVFIDDNPAERHIVCEELPNVSSPEIDTIHRYIQVIDRNGYFEVTNLSDDDRRRNDMYLENSKRLEFQNSFSDYNDYLISLTMKAVIKPFESLFYGRISQLSNKSNQFNLTTKRFTQDEIEAIANDSRYITLYGKLEDRFGDNGVVSLVIGKIEDNECKIELWLMSCRVLKRDMEFAMIDSLISKCQEKNIKTIRGFYYPTNKNAMVKDLYNLFGFTKIYEDDAKNSEWIYEIPEEYINKNKVIKVDLDNE